MRPHDRARRVVYSPGVRVRHRPARVPDREVRGWCASGWSAERRLRARTTSSPPSRAPRDELLLVHTAEYLDDLEQLRWTPRTACSELPLTAGDRARLRARRRRHDAGGARGARRAASASTWAADSTTPSPTRPRASATSTTWRWRSACCSATGVIRRAAVVDLRRPPGQRHRARLPRRRRRCSRFSIHQEHNYPVPRSAATSTSDSTNGVGDDGVPAPRWPRRSSACGRIAPELVLYQAGRRSVPRRPARRRCALTLEGLRGARPAGARGLRRARHPGRWSRWAAATPGGSSDTVRDPRRAPAALALRAGRARRGRVPVIRAWHRRRRGGARGAAGEAVRRGAQRARAWCGSTSTARSRGRARRCWRRSASTRWCSTTWSPRSTGPRWTTTATTSTWWSTRRAGSDDRPALREIDMRGGRALPRHLPRRRHPLDRRRRTTVLPRRPELLSRGPAHAAPLHARRAGRPLPADHGPDRRRDRRARGADVRPTASADATSASCGSSAACRRCAASSGRSATPCWR